MTSNLTPKNTILIVDDEPTGQDVLEGLLAGQGYQMAFAPDGPSALAKAALLTPDVILLDVMMPGMDGFDVCRQLRADSMLAEVPIILITALDDDDSRLTGIEAGADDFITKPFNRVELRARIRTITKLNRYRRLQAERARFEWVVEQAEEGYLVVDEQDQIQYTNPKARLYLDLPVDSDETIDETFLALARQHYELQPEELWAAWPAKAAELFLPHYLIQPETDTANAFWLQVNVFEVPMGPRLGRMIRLSDVTEPMTMQQDMRGFHTSVLHKFRTPLTGMTGSLELLARHAAKLSTAEVINYAQVALGNLQRLKDEIEDVLAYACGPTLDEPGDPLCLVQLPALVSQISIDMGLQVDVVLAADQLELAGITLSPRAVEMILIETLENAKKFHPGQAPVVTIEVSPLPEQQVRFQISDNGLTLSPEQLASVWRPYYQGEKYFTGEARGMGLGLSIVASLVWGVGGTCHIYNRTDGPGVTVELKLPLAN
ncbi:MAG TPA: response regulator [Anaerolineae bacterium]